MWKFTIRLPKEKFNLFLLVKRFKYAKIRWRLLRPRIKAVNTTATRMKINHARYS